MQTVPIPYGARDRQYLLGATDAPRTPLLLFLHGRGCTAAWAVDETRLDTFARSRGFTLVAPQALRPDPDEPAKFLTNAPQWHADDVEFLDAVLADALDRTGANPRRVFVAGFSNGAAMTFRYAAARAERIAGIAAVSGHLGNSVPRPARPIPTLYLVGTSDPLVPLRGGEIELPWGNRLARQPPILDTLERWAAAMGCEPAARVERIERDGAIRTERFPGPVPFHAVTVTGLGHHWPGGRGQLNPRIGGPVSAIVDANERLWEFFESSTTPSLPSGVIS